MQNITLANSQTADFYSVVGLEGISDYVLGGLSQYLHGSDTNNFSPGRKIAVDSIAKTIRTA